MFSLTYCPHCKKTKEALTKLECPAYIVEVDNLGDGDAMKAWLKDKNAQSSFPMVILNGELVGGNSEFQALVQSGEAQKKIAEFRKSKSEALKQVREELLKEKKEWDEAKK